ncbi:MAG TPA: hypothetical protein VFW47_02250 [Phenylobacterium sp.]|nr:hypothetical protein [Phenylobacterium sp.]
MTEANLVALGAERLAAVLMAAAEDDPTLKRRLRMELASEVGPEDLAAEIAKRLTAIEGRRSRVHWRKYRAFAQDLDLQRAMIAGPLAAQDPKLALTLLWRFLALADAAMGQVDDSKGQVEATFRQAVADLGEVAARAGPDPEALAEQIVVALEDDGERLLDGLAAALVPALSPAGLIALRTRLQASFQGRSRPPPTIAAALREVADAQGDVEGYIAAIPASEARQPGAGAEIARRLLAAGRTEDALAALTRSAPPPQASTLLPGVQVWEDVYLDALEADGQSELAQEIRWGAFERRLAADRLRAYLKRLPDFDDVEAEERALAHAVAFTDFSEALTFLTQWPAAASAARLVLTRAGAIDPHRTELIDLAARLLEARHPLAATLLLRAAVADTLRWSRAERLKDAQRQLAEIESLAVQIADWGGFETHEDFMARLRNIRRA